MTKEELVLAILAAADGEAYQPVQIQKAVFLADRNLPEEILTQRFNFTPYDYGPFDSTVYSKVEELSAEGLASTSPASSGRWKLYAATPEGVRRGKEVLAQLPDSHEKYVREVARWVRSLSFGSLVKSIYSAYPEMRENSIFQG